MTATDPALPDTSAAVAGQKPASSLERLLLWGTGLGIVVEGSDLQIVIARARPGGPHFVASKTVHDFRSRPAGEWGTEVAAFLARSGDQKLAGTLLLPRGETIVRAVALAGVPDGEIGAAIELQVDTLHPYGDEEVAWSFCRTARGNAPGARITAGSILVGLVRKTVLDQYETLFAEAGIPLAAVSFSPAALYSSLRFWSATNTRGLLSFLLDERGRAEVYGESEARPVYSAEFPPPVERALAVARAELRLAPDTPARPMAEILPVPAKGSLGETSPLAWAAALAGAVPRSSRIANLLPKERRATHGRLQLLIPAFLGSLLFLMALLVFVVFPAVDQRRYANELNDAARRLEPAAKHVQALEARAQTDRARMQALDRFRGRTQADLDVLNELTRLLPPPIWTSVVEIYPDSVVLAGEAEQAAPLLKTLDSSPLFQGSEFGLSVTRNGTSESFRIRTMRRGRIGRTTP